MFTIVMCITAISLTYLAENTRPLAAFTGRTASPNDYVLILLASVLNTVLFPR